MTQITDHFADIRRRVALALDRAGRAGATVQIVAVSKQQPASAIEAAADAGLTHFGENYLQEALPKIAAVANPDLEWHFIGRIQSNKTRQIATSFNWVETVDRARIAERLNAQRPAGSAPLNVLIQVNADAEPQKAGVHPDQAPALADTIAGLRQLRLRGVMCIPEAGQSAADLRASFKTVAALAQRLSAAGHNIDTISMGMSSDFELAIECGATSVRIGTALFGART